MEIPHEISEFLRGKQLEAEGKKLQEQHKPFVKSYLAGGRVLPCIKSSTSRSISYKVDPLLNFLRNKGISESVIEGLYKKEIDNKAIDKLIKKGILKFDEIPAEAYTVTPTEKILVTLGKEEESDEN